MTSVLLIRGVDGCFKSCTAEGHAGFAPRGKDIVCAAETLLLRTAVQVLESIDGIDLSVDSSRRGFLSFSVNNLDSDVVAGNGASVERLRCAADFIGTGIQSLSEEYPDLVRLTERLG